MAGRYLVPLAFLLVLGATLGHVLLLSVDPTSYLGWWINQEVYSRLRGFLYVLDYASISPITGLLALAGVGTVCFLLRKSRLVCFAANHAVAVFILCLGFSQITGKAAALGFTDGGPHLLIIANWDGPVLAALLLAVLSCIPCHLDYLLASRRRTNA